MPPPLRFIMPRTHARDRRVQISVEKNWHDHSTYHTRLFCNVIALRATYSCAQDVTSLPEPCPRLTSSQQQRSNNTAWSSIDFTPAFNCRLDQLSICDNPNIWWRPFQHCSWPMATFTALPTPAEGKIGSIPAFWQSEIRTLNQHLQAGDMVYYCCHLIFIYWWHTERL